MKKPKVYGIDLGTTYSCIACLDTYGQPEVLINDLGDRTTPSVVYLSADGQNCCVGKIAKNGQVVDFEQTVSFIKREMGKDYTKPTSFPNGLTPIEISACILRKLVEDANNATDGEPSFDVVITCPAYFGALAREQTKQAGKIAGLNVLRIINEPTAAAVAYGAAMKSNKGKLILVYDLGGGTFDLSLIKSRGKNVKVLATGGDAKLGGYDWDRCLADYLLAKFNEQNSTQYNFENVALFNHFMLNAEYTKIILSSKEKCKVNIAWEGKSARFEITRKEFNKITNSLLQKTLAMTKEILANVGNDTQKSSLTEVLLVGGSSRMPQITEALKDFFAKYDCPVRLRDPDECVAKGAALVAQSELSEDNGTISENKGIVLADVTSKAYGFLADDFEDKSMIFNIIYKNMLLPTEKTSFFQTKYKNQQSIFLGIYESDSNLDRILPSEGIPLDTEHTLEGLPPGLPIGTKVEVKYAINKEGILTVTVKVKDVQMEFPIKLKGVMDSRDVRDAKKDLSEVVFDS